MCIFAKSSRNLVEQQPLFLIILWHYNLKDNCPDSRIGLEVVFCAICCKVECLYYCLYCLYWLVGLATISYGHNFVIHKLFLISVIRWPTWFDIPWSSFLWISPICSGAPKDQSSQFHRHLKKAAPTRRSTSNIIEIRLDPNRHALKRLFYWSYCF